MGKFIDITGMKFNMLTVVKKASGASKNKIYWECICECGNTAIVMGSHLKSLAVKSCGCMNHLPKHNKTKSKIYSKWRAMRNRCNNKSHNAYERYGGRGITVCEEWDNKKDGSTNFIKWALANGYSDELTIDRIDGTRGYSPDNCRFADHETQTLNRNVKINNKTGITGVHKTESSNRYYAQITFKRKTINLGTFDTIEEAANARKIAEERYHKAYLREVENDKHRI